MATDLIQFNADAPDEVVIDRAVAAVAGGGVIAVPTEALYTLIADPRNLHAVSRVFHAKGREAARALPLLVSDITMVEDLARDITKRFYALARRFWPGPLSVILPAGKNVPLKVTGNTGRVAVRHSRSKIIEAMVARLNHALVSTSANLSGQPTISSGIEVFVTMDGRVDLVFDGGACTGLGSSTVDLTEPDWRMIREGAISQRDVADCLKGL